MPRGVRKTPAPDAEGSVEASVAEAVVCEHMSVYYDGPRRVTCRTCGAHLSMVKGDWTAPPKRVRAEYG